jgi:hypothetical protein
VRSINQRKFDWGRVILDLTALVLVGMIIQKGWRDLDMNWDSLNYHLPLAALRAGVMSQKEYKLSSFIGAIYGGFPVIPDYLQGWAWRITSRVQAANLVGLMGLLALCGFAARWFQIRFSVLLLCLLAIPAILIGCSSSYVDLWANSVMTGMVLLLFRAFLQPEKFGMGDLFLALGAFSLSVNSKLQFLTAGPLALAGLAVILWVNRDRFSRLKQQWRGISAGGRAGLMLAAVILIGAGFANPVKDYAVFDNPIYPAVFSAGPLHWQGIFSSPGHEPEYLAHTIQPVKWLLSIFEFDAFDGRRPIWVVDGGYLPATSRALRMGGYFGAYVAMNLVWFAFLQRPGVRRYGRRPVVFFIVLSVITACLPISHELRYYSFWMMSLVVINLALIEESGEAGNVPLRFLFMGCALACLSFVVLSTGGVYVRPSNIRPKGLVADLGIGKKLTEMHLKEGEAVCVLSRSPFSILYAPVFNPEIARATHYREIVADSAGECGGARVVP